MFEDAERKLLDELLIESKLYTDSSSYKELLDFTIQLRDIAPFNAMLLHIQKPGLSYVATARDWQKKFSRRPKPDVRPLLILKPFGPVDFVYDVLDTEGKELPPDIFAFPTSGDITWEEVAKDEKRLYSKNIEILWIDTGDLNAGNIRLLPGMLDRRGYQRYLIKINRNHDPATQFATLIHELGHLFLSHLGRDKKLKIPIRRKLSADEMELEAESLAYIVCNRFGIEPKSEKYLSNYVDKNLHSNSLDIHSILRAANAVESILRITKEAR